MMTDNNSIFSLASWSFFQHNQPPLTLTEELQSAISDLGIVIDEINTDRLISALESAEIKLEGFKLVDTHPKLPGWWGQRNNKVFVPLNWDGDTLPSINFHPGVSAPENTTLFLGNISNYSILLWDSNSLLYVSPNTRIPSAHFAVGSGFVFVGPEVRSTSRLNINCRNRGAVVLTKDILIGSDVKFQSDDCHSIIALSSNTRINPFGGTIILKNHVWLGEDALVLGDTYISENCIIGARAFLRGVITPPNTIVAGIPARITRSDVTWDARDLPPDHFTIG